jgi:hypothetical protein
LQEPLKEELKKEEGNQNAERHLMKDDSQNKV